jgi:acyl-CoA synthetase (AMP-forming)/AMP-acid ligase II
MKLYRTIAELLIDRSLDQPDSLAYRFLSDGDKAEVSITYRELDRQARAISAHLQELQLQDSRAVLIYSYDSPFNFIAAFFGCLYAGVIAVPCHPPRNRHGIEELRSRLLAAEAKTILSETKLLGNLQKELTCSHYLATDELDIIWAYKWQEIPVNPENIAFLQYTSGSTGVPKGVIVTHQCLLFNQEMLRLAFGHTEKTIGVGWLPLFHDMGLIGNVLQPLYLGICCTFLSPIAFVRKPVRWLQAISRYRATTSGAPNFAYDLLCRHVKESSLDTLDLSSWEVAFSGAESIRVETIDRFTAKFARCGFRREAFYPCYGMAEASLLISGGTKTKPPIVKYVSTEALKENRVVINEFGRKGFRSVVGCGRAWLDGKIRIVDPRSLQLCGVDRIGEIWTSGSGIAQGYWQDPMETDRTFNAYIQNTQERAFLRTGDLGFLHEGELFITGRLHDILVFWGFNHYPQQIEQTVEECHPALKANACAAFALKIAGENRLAIAIELERTHLRSFDLTEIVENMRWAIFDRHFIDVCAIVLLKTGNLPKTSSGKIQRSLCQEKFLAGELEIVSQWQGKPQDMTSLMQRYLNPLTHLKRLGASIRGRWRRKIASSKQ